MCLLEVCKLVFYCDTYNLTLLCYHSKYKIYRVINTLHYSYINICTTPQTVILVSFNI